MSAGMRASVVIAVALAACTKPEDRVRDMFINHSELLDPSSAQFRRLDHKNDFAEAWCGEVNAKNRFGGYDGWQKFWISFGDDQQPQIHFVRSLEDEAGAVADPVTGGLVRATINAEQAQYELHCR